MSEDMDYDDILNMSFDELPEDKVLPDGRWTLRMKTSAYMKPRGEGSAKVLFFYQPVEPDDAVDMDGFEDYDYSQNQIVYTAWIEGNRSWKSIFAHLKAHVGVDFKVGTVQEVLKKGTKGAEITAELGERSFTNAFGELQVENTASNFRPLE